MSSLGKGLDLVSEADYLLETVRDHYAAGGVALPERQHLVAGDPREFAWDCEQLTVSLQGIGWGPATDSGSRSVRTGSPASVGATRHAILAVTLVRCTPMMSDDGTPPSATALDAAGREFMRDAGLMSQSMVTYVSSATKRLDRVASVEAGTVEPMGPSSTHHGVEAILAVTVGKLV